MPTYLSPGVYVEELESGSRPIEGVGTAVAAFVGLAERGPFNQPTLVTNWSQYTQTFGEFVEGAFLSHAVYGYFQNGGGACYVVRIGSGPERAAVAQLGTGGEAPLSAYRIQALAAGPEGNGITVEVADSEVAGAEEGAFKLVVKANGSVAETFDPVSPKRGKTNVVTVVNAQSQLIRIEETAKGAIESVARGSVSLSGGGVEAPSRLNAGDYVGDPASRSGVGGLEAVDEVTMVCVPDLMSAYQKGLIDLEGVKAVQLGMISHCELMGDRMAILDAPPGLNAQEVKDWRVNLAGYDSKYDPVLAVDQGVRPCHGHEHLRAALRPRRRDLGAQRRHARRPQGAGERGRPRRDRHRAQHHEERARPPQPGRDQRHPGLPRTRDPRLGGEDALERPGVALHQRASAVQLPRGVDPRRYGLGGVRAERPRAVGEDPPHDRGVPRERVAQGRPVRLDAERGVLREVRRRDEPRLGVTRRGAQRPDRRTAAKVNQRL